MRNSNDDSRVINQKAFDAWLANDVEITVHGQEHQLKGMHHSKEAFKNEVQYRIAEVIDYSKPTSHKVFHAMGGVLVVDIESEMCFYSMMMILVFDG